MIDALRALVRRWRARREARVLARPDIRYLGNPACTCGHKLSEHRPPLEHDALAECSVCACDAFLSLVD